MTELEILKHKVEEKYPFRMVRTDIAFDPNTFSPIVGVSVDEVCVKVDVENGVGVPEVFDKIEKLLQEQIKE